MDLQGPEKLRFAVVICTEFIFLMQLLNLLALAQKVAIRHSIRFSQSKLIEVNTASLFSRYFSESSKLVFALFSEIYELTLDEEIFVCVLIDEVESITTARKTTIGSDPSDAMRVVNVLLTQLDRMKTRPNVLIMATSNLPEISDRWWSCSTPDCVTLTRTSSISGSCRCHSIYWESVDRCNL